MIIRLLFACLAFSCALLGGYGTFAADKFSGGVFASSIIQSNDAYYSPREAGHDRVAQAQKDESEGATQAPDSAGKDDSDEAPAQEDRE
jgi:hypothetical protein